jgi:hypothetical protein
MTSQAMFLIEMVKQFKLMQSENNIISQEDNLEINHGAPVLEIQDDENQQLLGWKS